MMYVDLVEDALTFFTIFIVIVRFHYFTKENIVKIVSKF